MFGLIISGRPVITQLQVISPTEVAYELPAAPPFSHMVVFLLPGSQLPPETAASVYMRMPGASDYSLLSTVDNDKQSAVFKVNNALEQLEPQTRAFATVSVGIRIEPVAQAMAALQAAQADKALGSNGMELTRTDTVAAATEAAAAAASPEVVKLLAQRIIGNAYNFLIGFSTNSGLVGKEYVPIKAFTDWWAKFEKKVELDPSFLLREEQI